MKVKTETIIRTAVLVLALINQVLTASGHSILPVTEDQVAEIISLAITIGASVWAWWKNNSFTQAALEADCVMDELKAKKKFNAE